MDNEWTVDVTEFIVSVVLEGKEWLKDPMGSQSNIWRNRGDLSMRMY
jgi:hypothetical protein